jgi:hypothetical protein
MKNTWKRQHRGHTCVCRYEVIGERVDKSDVGLGWFFDCTEFGKSIYINGSFSHSIIPGS